MQQRDLRDQPLKAVSVIAGDRRLAQVVVDDVNTLARPTQQDSPFNQAILQLCTFLVMTHLTR
jgi:hypothetical protein